MTAADRHIVVGYDHGQASRHALDVAAALALDLNAHVHVVHVLDLSDYPVGPEEPEWEESALLRLAEEGEEAARQLQAWAGEWSYHLERGEPVEALCWVADQHEALMIVVGSGGQKGRVVLHRLLEGGSVSLRLVRCSRRPVLVVPLNSHSGLPPTM